jgi:glycosyltransferase involved in cell wall biosynthesis
MGLAALGVARILKLPVSGTFHASIPRHAHIHTEDGFISDVLWRYLVWFYEQMDRVYTSSQTAAEALVARGVHADKIHRHARGADIRFHHPRGDRDALRQRFGLAEGKTVFLYAGKLRRDRNLELLAEAFAGLSRKEPSALLVMAGDGPVRAKLEKALKGQPAIFTGHLDDESMAELYAACDVFVYPGDTDTFGDSVFEAQASGLPVIAPDSGAAMECVIPGETALVVKSNHRGALQEAMETLLRDPARRAAMGRAAHRHMEERDFDQAFEAMWRSPGGEARHEDEDRVLSIERLAGAALQEAMM